MSKIYVFGSRAKGLARADSDLDLAVFLKGSTAQERFLLGIDDTKGWDDELQSLIPVEVDLEFADPTNDTVVWPAVQDHGLLIFDGSKG